MAKTKDKKKGKGFSIRTVGSKADRSRPSVFMRLKMDESFKGIALFEPDPELEGNPGYFEYYDHWDQQGNQYVPCAGDKCPFCAANQNPSTRALTVWYFPENDVKDQIKVFTMNYGTINDISDEAEEEDGITGKKIRIKRMDDRGSYKIKVLTEKPLSKTEIKKALALLAEKFPNGLVQLVEKQLQAQMERLNALDALEDDDDDDDADEPKSRRGKSNSKAKAKDDDDDDTDDDDDDEDTDDDSDDDDDDDEDTDDDSDDDDDDDEDSDDDDSDDDDDDDEDSDDDDSDDDTAITNIEYEVVKFQEKDEILDLKNDDGKVKMWVGEGVEVDADEIKKGVKVAVSAQQDDEGDWIITELSIVKAKGGKGKGGKNSKKK